MFFRDLSKHVLKFNTSLFIFIDTYIYPTINSKDDLKHYYENIEILEELNKEEFLKCRNDSNYFFKNYYKVI